MVIKDIKTTLAINKAAVIAKMGYRDRTPPEMVVRRIGEQIETALKLIHPVYSYKFIEIDSIATPSFTLEGGLKFSSKTVSYALDGCQKVAVYVATLGPDIEKQITLLFSEKQTLDGTILDNIGSIAINQTLSLLRNDVKIAAEEMGFQTTRHYGPGHCDWELEQQQILFNALDSSEIGMQLNKACMILPRKSVSGVIGIGKIDQNKKTPCVLFCHKSANCEYRNL
jgi:hypothetical protein